MGKASELVKLLTSRRMRLAVAESCTGGLLAGEITSIPGSSLCFDRGYVTYSLQAKSEMLAIPEEIIEDKGPVSELTAILMAESARQLSGSQMACSITGVAGPGSDCYGNPEGIVYIALSMEGQEAEVERHQFKGGRQDIRDAAVAAAIDLMLRKIR